LLAASDACTDASNGMTPIPKSTVFGTRAANSVEKCGRTLPHTVFLEVLILNDFKSLFPEVLILIDFKSLFPEVLILVDFKPRGMKAMRDFFGIL